MIEGHLGSSMDSTEGRQEDSVILKRILDLTITMNVEVEEEIPIWTEEVAMIVGGEGVAMIVGGVGVVGIIAEDKEAEDR